MATTENYALPLPADSLAVKDTPGIIRDANKATDKVLDEVEGRVATAEDAAKTAAADARAAADLADAPADDVVAALLRGTGSATAAAMLAARTESLAGPLKIWGEALRNQKTRAAVWVSTGDSIANGGNSSQGRQWYDRVAALLGPRPVTPSLTTARPTTGVQVYNTALGGTTAANYLPDAKMAAIIALKPDLVTHLVGTNDYGAGVAPATYKEQLRARIMQLMPHAGVQLIISPHPRYDLAAPRYPWREYEDAMAAVAREFPASVAFLNLYEPFALMGPLADSYGVIHPDNLHVDDDGSKVMADIIGSAIGAPAPRIGRKIYYPPRVDGGESNANKTFAEIIIPARPWHQQFTFHASVYAYGNGPSTDIELFHEGNREPVTVAPHAVYVRTTANRQTYSGTLSGVIPPHSTGTLWVRYAPNGGSIYIEGGNVFYRSIYADVSPL